MTPKKAVGRPRKNKPEPENETRIQDQTMDQLLSGAPEKEPGPADAAKPKTVKVRVFVAEVGHVDLELTHFPAHLIESIAVVP